ncbi:MAG: Ppx/GppA family phosphatase [Coriobacteriia bacterium]|nr:Ppx/GppA family phosphatase [Coriobacteriia bacterium]
MLLAALDYGTVTSRLLIADVTNGQITSLLKKTSITHLGEGLAETGQISTAACERVIQASQAFLAEISSIHLDKTSLIQHEAILRAVATSAMRDASNSDTVVAALAELGISIEVIGGSREALLSFSGTISGFDRKSISGKTILVIDIGGGSTELTLGTLADPGSIPVVRSATSIDLGARRVTDRWLKSDPPAASEIEEARIGIHRQLASWVEQQDMHSESIDIAIAVAGTPTTLIAIRDRLEVYDQDHVHGQMLLSSQVAQLLDHLASLPVEQRRTVVGLEPARAEVVVGGVLILDELIKLMDLEFVTVSETDILQGVLLELWHELS